MSQNVNVEAKKLLAKLLATENLSVIHSGTQTASFDPKNRVLTLPIWKDMMSETYDSFIMHEIAHAIFTPDSILEGCKFIDSAHPMSAKSYLNVVEDIRINKLIKGVYAGAAGVFSRGYKILWERNFYGTDKKDVNTMSIVDRLNIHFKVGLPANVQFSDEEMQFVRELEQIMTWDEVLKLAKRIYEYAKLERHQKKQQQQQQSQSDEDMEPQSGDDSEPEDGEQEDPNTPGDDDGDGSDDGDDDGDEDTPPTQDQFDNTPVPCETELAWSSRESELIDKTAPSIKYLGIPKPIMDKIVIPHKTVHEQIRKGFSLEKLDKAKKGLNSFMEENKPVVSWLLKEFELHKSADQYARTRTSRTGELDPDALYRYRYSDDIMLRVAETPGGKKHAVEMFVDYSASMHLHLLGTIQQTITQVMFMRRAQIPHNVYTFGARVAFNGQRLFDRSKSANLDVFIQKPNDFAFFEGFALRTIFSHTMSSMEFMNACINVYALAMTASETYGGLASMPKTDQLANTPLNETIICASELVKKARKAGAQVVNVVFLTDGQATTDGMFVVSGNRCQEYYGKVILQDHETKTEYPLGIDKYQNTAQFLRILRERVECNVVGFYIAGTSQHAELALKRFCPTRWKEEPIKLQSEFGNQLFVVAEDFGYNEYYLIPGGKDLEISGKQKVSSDMTNDQIVSTMVNNGVKQKKQRVLLTRYIKLIS